MYLYTNIKKLKKNGKKGKKETIHKNTCFEKYELYEY